MYFPILSGASSFPIHPTKKRKKKKSVYVPDTASLA